MSAQEAQEPTNVKWEPPPDPMEIEQKVKDLVPVPAVFEKLYDQWYRQYEQKNPAVQMIRAKRDEKRAVRDINQGYADSFRQWLMGTSRYNVAKSEIDGKSVLTPWGTQSLLFLPDVREYLGKFLRKKASFQLKLAQLYFLGPRSLDEAYMYFKYLVSGEQLQVGDSAFLAEFNKFFPNHKDFKEMTKNDERTWKPNEDVARENQREYERLSREIAALPAAPLLSTGMKNAIAQPTAEGMNVVLAAFQDQANAMIQAIKDTKLQAPPLPAEVLLTLQGIRTDLGEVKGAVNTQTGLLTPALDKITYNTSGILTGVGNILGESQGTNQWLNAIAQQGVVIQRELANLLPINTTLQSLTAEMKQRTPEKWGKAVGQHIKVPQAIVNVPQPQVTLGAGFAQALGGAVNVHVPQAQVNVAAPNVQVAAPIVNVPQQDVQMGNAEAEFDPNAAAQAVAAGVNPLVQKIDQLIQAQQPPQQQQQVVQQAPGITPQVLEQTLEPMMQRLIASIQQQLKPPEIKEPIPFDDDKVQAAVNQAFENYKPPVPEYKPNIPVPGLEDVAKAIENSTGKQTEILNQYGRLLEHTMQSSGSLSNQIAGIASGVETAIRNGMEASSRASEQRLRELHEEVLKAGGLQNTKFAELLQSATKATDSFDNLHTNIVRAKDAQLAQMAEVADANRNQYEKALGELTALHQTLGELKGDSEFAAEKYTEIKAKIADMATTSKDLEARNKATKESLDQIVEEKSKLARELYESKSLLDQYRIAATTQSESLIAHNSQLQGKLKETESALLKYAGLETVHNQLLQSHGAQEKNMANLQQQMLGIQSLLTKSHEERIELQKQLHELNTKSESRLESTVVSLVKEQETSKKIQQEKWGNDIARKTPKAKKSTSGIEKATNTRKTHQEVVGRVRNNAIVEAIQRQQPAPAETPAPAPVADMRRNEAQEMAVATAAQQGLENLLKLAPAPVAQAEPAPAPMPEEIKFTKDTSNPFAERAAASIRHETFEFAPPEKMDFDFSGGEPEPPVPLRPIRPMLPPASQRWTPGMRDTAMESLDKATEKLKNLVEPDLFKLATSKFEILKKVSADPSKIIEAADFVYKSAIRSSAKAQAAYDRTLARAAIRGVGDLTELAESNPALYSRVSKKMEELKSMPTDYALSPVLTKTIADAEAALAAIAAQNDTAGAPGPTAEQQAALTAVTNEALTTGKVEEMHDDLITAMSTSAAVRTYVMGKIADKQQKDLFGQMTESNWAELLNGPAKHLTEKFVRNMAGKDKHNKEIIPEQATAKGRRITAHLQREAEKRGFIDLRREGITMKPGGTPVMQTGAMQEEMMDEAQALNPIGSEGATVDAVKAERDAKWEKYRQELWGGFTPKSKEQEESDEFRVPEPDYENLAAMGLHFPDPKERQRRLDSFYATLRVDGMIRRGELPEGMTAADARAASYNAVAIYHDFNKLMEVSQAREHFITGSGGSKFAQQLRQQMNTQYKQIRGPLEARGFVRRWRNIAEFMYNADSQGQVIKG